MTEKVEKLTKSLGRLTKNELVNQCINDLLRIMQLEVENVADAAAAFFCRSSEQTPWLFEYFQAAEEAFKEFAEPENKKRRLELNLTPVRPTRSMNAQVFLLTLQ